MTALATQLDPKLTSPTTATAAKPDAGFNHRRPIRFPPRCPTRAHQRRANVAEAPPITRAAPSNDRIMHDRVNGSRVECPADVSPGGSALNSTAPRHDAGVARTYGHLRECRQQHAVRADKDLARRGSDLHKWEFPHLLQLPWLNWQGRELMNREQPARSTPRLGFPSCAVAAWRGGQPAFGVARPMTLPRRAGLYMPRTDSRGG